MTMLLWNPAWETGVPLIDAQHRTLFDQVDRLFMALRTNTEREEVIATLRSLSDYIQHHFHTEEVLMRDTNYQKLEQHAAGHRLLYENVSKVLESHAIDPEPSPDLLMDYLQSWLMGHLDHGDRDLAAYLRRISITPA